MPPSIIFWRKLPLWLFFCIGYPQPTACASLKVLCLAVHLSSYSATLQLPAQEREFRFLCSTVLTCLSLSPHFLAKQEDIRVGLSSGEDIATIIKQNMVTPWRKWWVLAWKQNSVHGHWCEMCDCRIGLQSSDSLLKDMEIVCTWFHAHRVSMNAVNILPPSPPLCSVLSSAGSERWRRPLQSGRRCSLPEQTRRMQRWHFFSSAFFYRKPSISYTFWFKERVLLPALLNNPSHVVLVAYKYTQIHTQASVWKVGPFFCHALTGCVGMSTSLYHASNLIF